jgi:hypothetical protein
VTALLVILLAFADIAAVKAEPDLDRRSELALANADRSIDVARKAFSDSDDRAVEAALHEVADSVELSYDALAQTHKAPRKSKYYKSAELKVRGLIRRLSSFRDEVGMETRQQVDQVMKKLSDVHDGLINGIMSKRKE